jgi:universal stress protein family protein
MAFDPAFEVIKATIRGLRQALCFVGDNECAPHRRIPSIEWEPGDILLIGSSDAGPAPRVFLGAHATKILRHTPVPVIAVPRAAAQNIGEP